MAACTSPTPSSTATPRIPPTTEPILDIRAPTTEPVDIRFEAAQTERITEPNVSEEQFAAMIAGHQTFAFDFYRALPEGENIVFSPYSIAQAFSMLYIGARGDTAAEIVKVFGYLPQEQHHPAYNLLDQRVNDQRARYSTFMPEDAEEPIPFTLSIANSAWQQEGFPIEEAFLDTLAQHYGTGIYTLDFDANPEAARQTINGWVANETEERIEELLAPSLITPNTRLVLANAIYFKG